MYVISAEQSKSIDKETVQNFNIDLKSIIYKAGNAVYEVLRAEFSPLYTKKVCILCGKGHNGADGLALALILKKSNIINYVLIPAVQNELCDESCYYFEKLKFLKSEIILIDSTNLDVANKYISECDVIIDAIFGTGLNKDITGFFAELILLINSKNKQIISIDIPSGINGCNGRVMKHAVRADIVVIMQYLKYGNILNDADDYCRKKIVKNIGLAKVRNCNVGLLIKDEITLNTKKLNSNIHKYDKGNIIFFGGDKSMEGSVLLSAWAAYRSGAGLVHIAAPSESYDKIAIKSPYEVMVHEIAHIEDLKKLLNKKSAVAAGMGLTQNSCNAEYLEMLMNFKLPVILDAGALDIISRNNKILSDKKACTILTPHTKELSVLLNCHYDDILDQPIQMAKKAAFEFDSIVVLKMNKTIIADQYGNIKISDTKNNGLAKAGSGDVLSGIIASCIKYSNSLFDAACMGVYRHAEAGLKAAKKYGKKFMCASDIINNLSIEEEQ